MILPREPRARRDFYIDMGRHIASDRPERKAYNAELRCWYTRGTNAEYRVRYNKIKPHVKQSAAYLFQAKSVRFGAVLPPEYGDQFDHELETAATDFHRVWHDSKYGSPFTVGVRWAHVYPSVIWKVIEHGQNAMVKLIPDPSDVCVLETDKPFDEQEAKSHFFRLNLSQYKRLIAGHPMEADLLKAGIEASESGSGDEPTAPTVERLMFTSTSPQMTGVITRGSDTTPEADVDTARVVMCEMWIVDDRRGAWRCVTCLAPAGQIQRVIWDRIPTVLPTSDRFVYLSLEEAPDYTWGFSETDDLSGLQEWHEHRADQIDRMMELQLDPPIVLGGFGGLSDERAKRLRTPGGTLATIIPNPTANRLAPQMPPEAFAELNEIGKWFAEAGGMPGILSGQDGSAAKGPGQVNALAGLSSPTILDKAMLVEEAASEVATLVARMRRALSTDELMMPDGRRFLWGQLPEDIVMEVAAHSASPLLAELIKRDALEMLKVGAIDRPSYVRLKDPPMAQVLIAQARKLEAAAAKKAERLMKIQEYKAESKGKR